MSTFVVGNFFFLNFLALCVEPNQELLSKGVIFHHEGKILLTEKFVNVKFLVPFPSLNIELQPVDELLSNLQAMWQTPSVVCPLDSSSNFGTNASLFNVDWLMTEIRKEM